MTESLALSDTAEFRTLANLRVLSTVLQQRNIVAGDAGLTFGGQRDLYRALGYKRVLLPQDYRARYLRNGIAARIVEAAPKSTWRAGGELIEDEDPDTLTPFEEAWDELNKRLKVWSTFQRTDILCGMGRYAIIVIGAPGDFNTELTKLKAEELMYLSPFSEEDAIITRFEMDVTNERFGLPVEYMLRRTHVSMASIQPPSLMPGRPIHWSRVQHIADGLLDDHVYGVPRLERIWNLLDDLEKVVGGGAEAFWKRADAGMQLKLDPTVRADPKDLEAVKQQIEEYTDGLRRVLTTRGVDIAPLSSNVADFGSPVTAIMGQISASTGIPSRILTGSERGELASTQDRANWEERISDRRYEFAGPQVVRPFVDRMIELGVLPEPEQYEVRWPDIRNFNDAERAIIAGQWASINSSFGGIVVTANEIRDRVLGMEPLSPEELAPPAPPVPPVDPSTIPPPEDPATSAEDDATATADAKQAAEDQRIAAQDAKKAKAASRRLKARILGLKPPVVIHPDPHYFEDVKKMQEVVQALQETRMTDVTAAATIIGSLRDEITSLQGQIEDARSNDVKALMAKLERTLEQKNVVEPEAVDTIVLREAIEALRASTARPVEVTVNVPHALKKKSITRTATGFEIQEEEVRS
jgi:hypothetical protein